MIARRGCVWVKLPPRPEGLGTDAAAPIRDVPARGTGPVAVHHQHSRPPGLVRDELPQRVRTLIGAPSQPEELQDRGGALSP